MPQEAPSQDLHLDLQQQQHLATMSGPQGSQTQQVDLEQLQRTAEATAAAAQAAADALRAASGSGVSGKRKPDLPNFDSKNVEIWIRRVEAAYTRASIVLPKDKFAFVETKFSVDFNPRINEFLYSTATDDNWNDFLSYLRQEYGRTRQQQASSMIDGLKRDGRRPSQWLATLVDLTKDVSLDDIRKELLLRELPSDVKRTLANGVKDMSAKEVAELADDHYDRDGRQLNGSSVHSVSEAPEQRSVHFDDEPQADGDIDEVNAVQRQGRRSFSRNRSSTRASSNFSKPFSGNNNNDRPASRDRRNFSAQRKQSQNSTTSGLCFYHKKFGKAAKQCSDGCSWKDKEQGNGNRGRRM